MRPPRLRGAITQGDPRPSGAVTQGDPRPSGAVTQGDPRPSSPSRKAMSRDSCGARQWPGTHAVQGNGQGLVRCMAANAGEAGAACMHACVFPYAHAPVVAFTPGTLSHQERFFTWNAFTPGTLSHVERFNTWNAFTPGTRPRLGTSHT
eukprot:365910-Chlamydomonas_euryale.AAC.28